MIRPFPLKYNLNLKGEHRFFRTLEYILIKAEPRWLNQVSDVPVSRNWYKTVSNLYENSCI